VAVGVAVCIVLVALSTALPMWLLYRADRDDLELWSLVGQALTPVSIVYSGLALFAVVFALFMQRRELANQRQELTLALEEQRRSSEIALRALHVDLIKMAIEDGELAEVWPPLAPGMPESRKDHYCNLILNLQKVAYEAKTIELAELKGALAYLMRSRDVYSFWRKARGTRIEITEGDEGEDFFTRLVDEAFRNAEPAES
jgi:hypothetical protein